MQKVILKLNALVTSHKQIVLYLFYGICTTAINTICYWLFCDVMGLGNVVGTVLAWVAAVVFAFITNKIRVFKSCRKNASRTMQEALSFFGSRLLTGILDVGIMAITVGIFKWNGFAWKLISNVIVTIVNYILSRFFVFRGTNNF